jgi:hypothetical protein
MKLKITLNIGTGMLMAGAIPVAFGPILFNGVPLLYNGEEITFTNA